VVNLGLRVWLMGMLIAPLIPALAMLCSDYVVGKIRVCQPDWNSRKVTSRGLP
jgi:hypothetical protein